MGTSATTSGPDAPTPHDDPPPQRRGNRFPSSLRWTLVFFVVMVALIVAIWPRDSGSSNNLGSPTDNSGVAAVPDAKVDDATLAKARADAAVEPCPNNGLPESSGAVLAGVVAPCLATGSAYNLGAGTAGKPVLINMWAVWCLPCRRELPVLAEYARRAGDRVTVLTVHAEQGAGNPFAVLTFLREVGVHLPTVLDVDGKVAAALRAPRVFPSTILLRPDGTIATTLPKEFGSVDEVADAVRDATGVAT
ncbi:TlpA disulfide reductase family protein [Gordonia sp. w5E2]|uniref:Alkyl hydroperoxide reductase n=1 Tax=Gordonia jacobaea TaxID=122202 RepID=A0ABR5I847_9ACTN|nr:MULTISPECIES: TlpA disulfide reductase family protein [Gordonia]KNA89787.1 alkyl hydroperoxide reductase [Gordonia jacobaea]